MGNKRNAKIDNLEKLKQIATGYGLEIVDE